MRMMDETMLGMVLGGAVAVAAYFWKDSFFKNDDDEDEDDDGAPRRVYERDFTASDLKRCDGKEGRVTYVAMMGKVFDLGGSKWKNLFQYSGHDLTNGLAIQLNKNKDFEIASCPKDLNMLLGVKFEDEGDLKGFSEDIKEGVERAFKWFQKEFKKVGRLVRPREYSLEELAKYDGLEGRPIYLAAKGEVFDVTRGEDFYGPEGAYHIMAGHDASRALALMSLEKKDIDNCRIDDLGVADISTLDEWVAKFHFKYTLMGWLEGHKKKIEQDNNE